MAPVFTVVIPTYNRLDILPEVLQALENQVDAPPFEVIVIDDGSTDGTADWLAEHRHRIPVEVLTQPNSGPARARNRGIRAASGEWVAILGDDTVPAPDWLAWHHHAHQERCPPGLSSLAVIGYTSWHPRMRLDPFLSYINEYGLQFGYALIQDPDDVPFNFFYTSNLSLRCELLLREPFDERFPYAAWEDIETSYRLSQRHGMRLIYEQRAQVAHDHPTRLRRFMDRQEKAGYSAVVFYLLHRELGSFLGLGPDGPPPLPAAGRQRRLELLAGLLARLPLSTPKLWEEVLRYHYIRGLHRGWADRETLL